MYPYNLCDKDADIFPIFWNSIGKNIGILSMDNNGTWISSLSDIQIQDQNKFQSALDKEKEKHNFDIIVSEYLENREQMFRALWYDGMVQQNRFFHLWLDLTVPKSTVIHAPIDWVVYEAGYEAGDWNYGWYIILEHTSGESVYYSLYWHLDKDTLEVKTWDTISAGRVLWYIWWMNTNWGYFYHLHLQVITKKWKDRWFLFKWYCTDTDLQEISQLAPNPSFLFKY